MEISPKDAPTLPHSTLSKLRTFSTSISQLSRLTRRGRFQSPASRQLLFKPWNSRNARDVYHRPTLKFYETYPPREFIVIFPGFPISSLPLPPFPVIPFEISPKCRFGSTRIFAFLAHLPPWFPEESKVISRLERGQGSIRWESIGNYEAWILSIRMDIIGKNIDENERDVFREKIFPRDFEYLIWIDRWNLAVVTVARG